MSFVGMGEQQDGVRIQSRYATKSGYLESFITGGFKLMDETNRKDL